MKIKGNTVGTTMPRADWSQTDETKADYIKNKPTVLDGKDGVDGKDGKDGETPYIKDGNWWIGETDTGVKAQGVDGVNGVNGKDGTNGIDGKDGANGKDGVSATHSWNGTTLTITSASGTSSANLKGEQGIQGIQGEKGDKGDKGEQGIQGEKGIQGIQGVKGDKGEKGDKGDTGEKGAKGDPYILTEADKAEITRMIIESLGGNPVFGYVDANNNIIVSGNLADGTYNVKYEMEDGSIVGIGNLELDTNVYYSVTPNAPNCNFNGDTQAIGGNSYSATISANSGYTLSSIIVKMGGIDITSSAVNGGNINIANVTGDIVITAVAEKNKPAYTNLATPKSGGWDDDTRIGSALTEKTEIGMVTTNFIPVVVGDVIRIKNIILVGSDYGYSRVVQDDNTNDSIAINLINPREYSGVFSVENGITSFTIGNSVPWSLNCPYIRIAGYLPTGKTSADVIITKNEEIV